TGVLVICVGAATRLISFVQQGRKVYRARFRLGVTSITDDIEGVVTAVPDAPRVSAAEIEAVLPEFVGTIEQVPPIFSAVHVGGKRAYELARKGEQVTLSPRQVHVRRFELLLFNEQSQEFEAEIECGAGTYIRSLGCDVARRLGTSAVMTNLRRTAVGSFHIDDSVRLDDLERDGVASSLLPLGAAVGDLKRSDCDSQQIRAIRPGLPIPEPAGFVVRPSEKVALFCPRGTLAAVSAFEPRDATLRPKIVFPEDDRLRSAE